MDITEVLIYNLIIFTDNTMYREQLAKIIGKTIRTVQRALGILIRKGYIVRKCAKIKCIWEILN